MNTTQANPRRGIRLVYRFALVSHDDETVALTATTKDGGFAALLFSSAEKAEAFRQHQRLQQSFTVAEITGETWYTWLDRWRAQSMARLALNADPATGEPGNLVDFSPLYDETGAWRP